MGTLLAGVSAVRTNLSITYATHRPHGAEACCRAALSSYACLSLLGVHFQLSSVSCSARATCVEAYWCRSRLRLVSGFALASDLIPRPGSRLTGLKCTRVSRRFRCENELINHLCYTPTSRCGGVLPSRAICLCSPVVVGWTLAVVRMPNIWLLVRCLAAPVPIMPVAVGAA